MHEDGMITDIDDSTQSHKTKFTLEQIAENARRNGDTVKTFTSSELKERDEKIRKERENAPDYELGYGVPWGNREYRKTARQSRIASRRSR